MEPPTHKLRQRDVLDGMSGDIRERTKGGACWGLSVRWLVDCVSAGPSVAGLAMTEGFATREGAVAHADFSRQKLTTASYSDNICNSTLMMSSGRLYAEHKATYSAALLADVAIPIINTISIATAAFGGKFYGLIIFPAKRSAHAISIAYTRNVWALFDPNFGTWTIAGNSTIAGDRTKATNRLIRLLRDIFRHYGGTRIVTLYTVRRIFTVS